MNVLMDTHIVIWALADAPALSPRAREIILNGDNEVYVSDASVWEIAVKSVARPGILPFGSCDFIEACKDAKYSFLPITHDAIVAYENLDCNAADGVHKDPFDRLLIAQAKASNMLFLTHDKVLRIYGEPLVSVV